MKILLKNGRIYDPRNALDKIANITIENGIITFIDSFDHEADKVIDCTNKWIVPSITDMHVHCFKNKTNLGLESDWIGIHQNVGNIVDAGSCGSKNIKEFIEMKSMSQTNVKLFINYSSIGLTQGSGELSNDEWFNEDELEKVIQTYPNTIKGIKLRASQSVVKDKGIEPIHYGATFAHKHHLPVMVHVGNEPPKLDDVFHELIRGDIVTHVYHGKEGGIILKDGSIDPLAIQKYQEGVLFDVGHGSASFNFDTAEKAFAYGLIPHLISSDLHVRNYQKKIQSLSEVVTKIFNLGLNEKQILDAISIRPARILDLKNEIKKGSKADLSIVSFNHSIQKKYVDADGNERVFDKEVIFESLIRERREIIKEKNLNIDSIITERSREWQSFTEENHQLIKQICEKVLEESEKEGIVFDESAGITFVTHLTTLFDRLFISHEQIDIDEEMFSQIEELIQKKANHIAQVISRMIGKELPRSEIFLIATHLGAMKERMNEKEI